MSAKEQALIDIKKDLKKNNKCFLAFRSELNPVMRRLVYDQLKEQSTLAPSHAPSRANSQLVAHCFIAKGEVQLNDYTKYYKK